MTKSEVDRDGSGNLPRKRKGGVEDAEEKVDIHWCQ